jgi:hypothetical protein
VEGSPAILVKTVDVCTIHEKLLYHANLPWIIVKYCIVKRGTSSVISHVDEVCRVSAENGKNLLS